MNLYQRCKLLSEVLNDQQRICKEYGNEGKARDFFKRQYFSDVIGKITLDDLIDLYEAYPDEADWAEHHYMLIDMVVMYDEARRAETPHISERLREPRKNWKKKALELEEELELAKGEIEYLKRKLRESAQ